VSRVTFFELPFFGMLCGMARGLDPISGATMH
jgi:hypothetical protein